MSFTVHFETSMVLSTTVAAVHRDAEHRFSKARVPSIELIAGSGVAGDAHAGHTARHRSRVRADPSQPNLRQVHLISESLFAHLQDLEFNVVPGELGENITLSDAESLDWRALIALPVGTQLLFASGAMVQLTGLRNPCRQIETHQRGLLAAMLGRDDLGQVVRKAGVMSIVLVGGTVAQGDHVTFQLPAPPHRPMQVV